MPYPRRLVYAAIDDERDYQDELGPDRTSQPGGTHTVGEYITMLQHYQNKLVEAWTDNPGEAAALDVMRKIAGIAVHCMEDNGVVHRNPGWPLKDPEQEELDLDE